MFPVTPQEFPLWSIHEFYIHYEFAAWCRAIQTPSNLSLIRSVSHSVGGGGGGGGISDGG